MNCENESDYIEWHRSPFYVNKQRKAWKGAQRMGAVSAFGISGTNAHMVVQSHEPVESAPAEGIPGGWQLLVLSAKTPLALQERVAQLREVLQQRPWSPGEMHAVGHTLLMDGVDFIYTDVWVSMGEPVETWGDRIELLLPFQVNSELMVSAGNPRVKFMHCLPAFHNSETVVGAKIAAQYPHLSNGIAVTEDVFESPANIAFEQAENRMHTIKAVLVAALS